MNISTLSPRTHWSSGKDRTEAPEGRLVCQVRNAEGEPSPGLPLTHLNFLCCRYKHRCRTGPLAGMWLLQLSDCEPWLMGSWGRSHPPFLSHHLPSGSFPRRTFYSREYFLKNSLGVCCWAHPKSMGNSIQSWTNLFEETHCFPEILV